MSFQFCLYSKISPIFETLLDLPNSTSRFAGQETTSHTLTWCIAFMITNPDVQQKLHNEFDRVISSDRLITVSDKPDLPYCNALIMETQRLANIITLNAMRTTTREVTINGYRMPKGTIVTPQISVLMADPKV
jgi:cytochrome P450